jgi:hypothetical protein
MSEPRDAQHQDEKIDDLRSRVGKLEEKLWEGNGEKPLSRRVERLEVIAALTIFLAGVACTAAASAVWKALFAGG